MQHTVGSVTVSPISSPGAPGFKNPNDVKFKVEYSKDFKGEKSLPEGDTITVSKESAEHFTALGFGSVVTETEDAAPISTPGAPDDEVKNVVSKDNKGKAGKK